MRKNPSSSAAPAKPYPQATDMARYRSERRERMVRWIGILLIFMMLATVVAGVLGALLA